jgi:DNA-binding NarL/FixJ family response regulator
LAHSINKASTRVLIADDHAMVAEALRSILQKEYEVVGIVSDGQKLLEQAPILRPHVVVVDLGMPLLNGWDAAQELKQVLPEIKIVFLTMNDDPNIAAAAMELGAVGYVLKSDASSELLNALSEVLLGKSYVTRRLRAENWAEQELRVRQFEKKLTFRQAQVLQLLAEGRPMKEVASLLGISEKTVEFHKYHIMRVFHLRNNSELVRFALKSDRIS